MKEVNVLFVYPNKDTVLRIPLAGSILCAALRQTGHNVKLLDATFIGEEFKTDIDYSEKKGTVKKVNLREYIGKLDNRPLDEIVRETLKDFSPDLIAITILERTYSNALELLKVIKKYTNAPVLAGGIMASIAPEILVSVEGIDMICLGEGEETIVEVSNTIANGQDIRDIKNLWIKRNGKIIKNLLRRLINMDDVPEQDWEPFDERHLYRAFKGGVYRNGTFEFSRGCQKVCSFCVAPKLRELQRNLGASHRFKSPEHVIDEICTKKVKYDLNLIHFGDADFLFGMKREVLEKFVQLYKKRIDLPFLIQTGAETLDEERIKLLKTSGCANVSVGVESGSEKIRTQIIRKYVPKKKLTKAFKLARKHKLRMTANYMVGLPDETEGDVWESIRFNRELNPPAIAVFFFTPFVGTELYNLSLKRGYVKGFNPDTNIHKESPLNMPQLPKQRISELVKIFVDDFERYKDEY